MYEMMYQYDNLMRQYDETMSFVQLYVTNVHTQENYIHYRRGEECLQRLINIENQMVRFISAFQNACSVFFTADIGPEWLQTYFMRKFQIVRHRIKFIERTLSRQAWWSRRPLPNQTTPIFIKRRNSTTLNLS